MIIYDNFKKITILSKLSPFFFNILLIFLLSSAVVRSNYFLPKMVAWISFGMLLGVLLTGGNFLKWILSLSLIVFIGFLFRIPLIVILSGLFSLMIMRLIINITNRRDLLNYFCLIFIVGSFLVISIYESKNVINSLKIEPVAGQYTRDPNVFLKTFFLMSGGVSYYDAFGEAYRGDFRNHGFPYDLWAYRLPTTFILWKLLAFNNPLNLYILFLFFSSCVLTLTFYIGKKILSRELSLIIPFLFVPYFVFGGTSLEFLQMEWWGLLPFFLFIFGVFFERLYIAAFGASLALISRELFLIPILSAGLISVVFKQYKLIKVFLTSIIVFSLVFVIHAFFVFERLPFSIDKMLTGRYHTLTLEFIRQVLANGSWRYLFSEYRLFSLYTFCQFLIGISIFIFQPKYRFIIGYLLSLFITTLIIFLKIGLCCWTDNWGVMVDPFIILGTGLIMGLFFQSLIKNRQIKLKSFHQESKVS